MKTQLLPVLHAALSKQPKTLLRTRAAHILSVALATAVLASCSTAPFGPSTTEPEIKEAQPNWDKPKLIQPGHTIRSQDMQIKLPLQQQAWLLVSTSPMRLVQPDPNDLYTRIDFRLQLIEAEQTITQQSLLDLIQADYQSIQAGPETGSANNAAPRAQLLQFASQADHNQMQKASLPCVRTTSHWLVPTIKAAPDERYFIDRIELACQHPHHPQAYFVADYGYQGQQQYFTLLEPHAQQFFDRLTPIKRPN